jgi:hypothetical protein
LKLGGLKSHNCETWGVKNAQLKLEGSKSHNCETWGAKTAIKPKKILLKKKEKWMVVASHQNVFVYLKFISNKNIITPLYATKALHDLKVKGIIINHNTYYIL